MAKSLKELKRELSALALEIAAECGVELDRSPESVKHVERILGEVHKEYQETGEDEGLDGVALEFAAYIIEVIEKNYTPGVWKRNHKDFGPDSFPYGWEGSVIFPYGWCQKRIYDGPGDDVWAKFQALVIHRDRENG
jgi:hypothetical protein